MDFWILGINLSFSKKRGRPRVEKEKNDYGTLELRNKRLLELTTEPLDLCFKKQLITIEEHEAGIRLRWLYTLKFGSPDISAYSFEPAGSSCFRNDDSAPAETKKRVNQSQRVVPLRWIEEDRVVDLARAADNADCKTERCLRLNSI